jgi:hypothetical protein
MHVLAAVADGPTAALAVVALVFGLFVVARGRRGERVEEEASGSLLSLSVVPAPVAATADATAGAGEEPDGLQTMAVGEIGHGAIRLGTTPRAQPAPAPAAEPAAAEPPSPEPQPELPAAAAETATSEPSPEVAQPPEPEPPLDPPTSWTAQPAPPLPAADPAPPADPPRSPDPPPAADPPGPFRQGRIRLRKPPGQ